MLAATNMATGVAVTNAATFNMRSSNYVAFQLNLNALGLGATNKCDVTLQNSVDGSNWQSWATMTLTGTSNVTAMCVSNFQSYGIPLGRVQKITSTANGTGTNLNMELWMYGKSGI
jgi:hypothetical protein